MSVEVISGVTFNRSKCKVIYRDKHKNMVPADASFPVPMIDYVRLPTQGQGRPKAFEKSPLGPYKCVLHEDGYFYCKEDITLTGASYL